MTDDDKPVRRYGVDDHGAQKLEPPLVEETHILDLKPPMGITYPDHLRDCYFRLEIIQRRAVSVKIFGVHESYERTISDGVKQLVASHRREIFPKEATDLGFDRIEIHAKVKPENTT